MLLSQLARFLFSTYSISPMQIKPKFVNNFDCNPWVSIDEDNLKIYNSQDIKNISIYSIMFEWGFTALFFVLVNFSRESETHIQTVDF